MSFVTPAPFAYLSNQGASVSYFISASGGTITYDGDYKIHTFTTTGSNTFTVFTTGSSPFNTVELLLVGGGGAGAASEAAARGNVTNGGGGAGGLIYTASYDIISGSNTVIVGRGASGSISSNSSSFSNLIAYGGQNGGTYYSLPVPNISGSGGGMPGMFCGFTRFGASCASCNPYAGNGTQPNGYANDGGPSSDCITYSGAIYRISGGAGGGAGSDGGTTTGGAGRTYSISGTSIEYAKGGNCNTATAALPANRGSGGDAGYFSGGVPTPAIPGSSGVVIIRYRYQ